MCHITIEPIEPERISRWSGPSVRIAARVDKPIIGALIAQRSMSKHSRRDCAKLELVGGRGKLNAVVSICGK